MNAFKLMKNLTLAVALSAATTTAFAEIKKTSRDYKGVTILASEGERIAYKFANPKYKPRCKKVLRDGNRYVWVCAK